MENEKRFEEIKGFEELTKEERENTEGGYYNIGYKFADKIMNPIADWYDSWR